MARPQTGCESSAGLSSFGKSGFATNLANVGIKKRWQEALTSSLAGKIGLGGQAYVTHPDYDRQWDLGYNRNLIHACAAFLLWALFIWFVCFQLFHATCDLHNLTECITSQRTQTKPWNDQVDPTIADVYMRSFHHHLSLKLSSCLIKNGNYAGYAKNRALNRIDPVEGGCASPHVENLSSEQALKTHVADGGCKLFESDNAYRNGWCHRVSGPVVGQYGDPAYSFVKIDVVANTTEMFAKGNYTNLDFIYPEFVGGKKQDDYNSVYYTFDPFYPVKKEMFFQRSEIVKHSSLEFLSSKVPEPERTYLQYHHEYNRWERSNVGGSSQIRSGLLTQESITVATIYLRATSTRMVYDERQVKTLYDFPRDAGGFWTACLFLGAMGYLLLKMVFPVKTADFAELLQREQHKRVRQAMVASKQLPASLAEVADGELSVVVSQASSDFVCGKPVLADWEQSVELSHIVHPEGTVEKAKELATEALTSEAQISDASTTIAATPSNACSSVLFDQEMRKRVFDHMPSSVSSALKQDLERPASPRVQLKGDEENGDQPCTELPPRLEL